MALPQGIYFRQLDDQADPTNYEAEVSTTTNYPRVSDMGNNVGWEQNVSGTRDRGGAGAVELRGITFVDGTATADYRITLPATGNYNIRAAFGDEGGGQTDIHAELLDTTTSFATPLEVEGTLTAGHYVDATGIERTSQADWTANNATLARTFTTTIFRVRLGESSGGNSPIAAVYIEEAAADTGTDRYLLESGAPDGYLLEDGSGVLLQESAASAAGNRRRRFFMAAA